MASSFYVRIAGNVRGPFDTAMVKQLAFAGKIGHDDELSRDREKWTPARNVKGLVLPALPTSAEEAVTLHGANSGASTATALETVVSPAATADLPTSANVLTVEAPASAPLRRSRASMAFNLEACPDCGQFVSLRAYDCPNCGGPIRRQAAPQPKSRYRLLRLMSSAYATLGIIALLLAAFVVAVLIYCIAQGDLTGATAALLVVVACITAGITCFAASEAMQVFLQIEQNTRTTGLAITRRS